MRRSRLLDKGSSVMLIYPEVVVVNDRGTPLKVPSETPVEIYVSTMEDRSSTAELSGQLTARVIRCQTRSAPAGSWARVVYDNEEWDIAIPPRFSPGVSKATQHVEFTIRSRNQVNEVLD